MSWQEILAVSCVIIGLIAGGYLAAQRPAFWVEFFTRLLISFMPFITKYISKRMTPEEEKAFQKCVRQGGEWDHFRKRCK
jgi:hypothetical protein